MTPLCQRMTEELQVHNLLPHTRKTDINQVYLLARTARPRSDLRLPGVPRRR